MKLAYQIQQGESGGMVSGEVIGEGVSMSPMVAEVGWMPVGGWCR